MAKADHVGRCRSGLLATARSTLLTAALSVAGAGVASAYVGDSFLDVPGVAGGWPVAKYKNWVRADANYWESTSNSAFAGMGKDRLTFSAPPAPKQGAGALAIMIDKHSPALAELMDRCTNKTTMPQLTYAESSVRSRGSRELGPRPADIPEYVEYRLKDVRFSDCPVVADAPEQAFVVSFNDIEWLNYHHDGNEAILLKPSDVKPVKTSAKTKSFVVTWFAVAHDISDDQCPTVNAKPTDDDYYALMSKEDAAKERAENDKNGGIDVYDKNDKMALRGPDKLNVCRLPGIVKDPGHATPQTTLARGLNLDGNDGRGTAPAGTCVHKNYVSADGRTGIDNALYAVQGCVPGYMGHKGFFTQYANEQRRNGLVSVLVEISGIDNERNDNSVDVTLFYSLDHMAKDSSGKQMLSDYTFRLTDKPEYTHYFTRVHGKIVNGVVITDPVKQMQFNLGLETELTLHDAALRLEITPDGNLKGVVGGYQDWHDIMASNGRSLTEAIYGYQCPSMYNAFRRYADGMKNTVTGECDGISSAYDIEGVPAFIAPAQPKVADKASAHHQVAQADATGQKAP